MSAYAEIEDIEELATLNMRLSEKLGKALRHSEIRKIGTPSGSTQTEVHFLARKGKDVFWWVGKPAKNKKAMHNLFGHGAPGAHEALTIDIQFNLPIRRFARTRGGAFLREAGSGDILMAHRGIVTLGHGRVPIDILFAGMDSTLLQADTSSGKREFLSIGKLDSPSLIRDISRFSAQLRRIVRTTGSHEISHARYLPKGRRNGLSRLRGYFDEFSGQKKVAKREKLVADCYHGDIVGALRRALDSSPPPLKSREVDLVGFRARKACVFEVKTGADTQSVYTAVGQLAVHAPMVAASLGRVPLEIIVLPEKPISSLYETLTSKLRIRVLTFSRSPQGRITVHGLEELG